MRRFLQVESEEELRHRLWQLLAGSLLLQLFFVMTTAASAPDIAAFFRVNEALRSDPLNVYGIVNTGDHTALAWPYPPLYLPALLGLTEIAQVTGISFPRLVRLPEVAATLTMAWLVQWHLGYRGFSPRVRLLAAAMIALNPVMLAMSSMHGQIDPVQWLPAVAAVIAWERLPAGRRAPVAGLLVGIGAGIKIMPGLVLLALLPLARDHRERLVLAGCAVAVPLLAFAPFLLADFSGARSILDYTGVAGHGGLSVLVQPDLAVLRFSGGSFDGFSPASEFLQDAGPVAVLLVTVAIAVRLFQLRPDPAAGAAALVLGVFVFGVNYFPSYAAWLIPFVVLAGWTRFYWTITALMLIPIAFRYLPAWLIPVTGLGDSTYHEWAVLALYVPTAGALWAVYAWKLASFGLGSGSQRRVPREPVLADAIGHQDAVLARRRP